MADKIPNAITNIDFLLWILSITSSGIVLLLGILLTFAKRIINDFEGKVKEQFTLIKKDFELILEKIGSLKSNIEDGKGNADLLWDEIRNIKMDMKCCELKLNGIEHDLKNLLESHKKNHE